MKRNGWTYDPNEYWWVDPTGTFAACKGEGYWYVLRLDPSDIDTVTTGSTLADVQDQIAKGVR